MPRGLAGLRDHRSRRPRVPGGEAPRASGRRVRAARMARRASDHRQSRSGRPPQGGLGLRPFRSRSRYLPPRVRSRRSGSPCHACVGELSLDGRVRPVAGAIAVAEGARRSGLDRVLCASESAPEAALAGIDAVPVRHLAEAVAYLRGEAEPRSSAPNGDAAAGGRVVSRSRRGPRPGAGASRARDRRGRRRTTSCSPARRAPGKTMLARRLPSILPPLTPRRGARGDAHPLGRGAAAAGPAARDHAAVPRAAPRHVCGRGRRRRRESASRRGEPGAPRRAAARRAARVRASGPRVASSAARRRSNQRCRESVVARCSRPGSGSWRR